MIPLTPHRAALFREIDHQIAQLGWTVVECRAYVAYFYNGKTSRHQLDDDQLENFQRNLRRALIDLHRAQAKQREQKL